MAALERAEDALEQRHDGENPMQKHAAVLKAFIEKSQEIFPHWYYQIARINLLEAKELVAEYKQLAEQHPDSALYRYLSARALALEGHQDDAIEKFNALLETATESPWPHLSLARVYGRAPKTDRARAQRHLDALLKACPRVLEAYEEAAHIGASSQTAHALREILASREDRRALAAYRTLWTLEFQNRPSSEYPALRKQVASDLERIRNAAKAPPASVLLTLKEGYALSEDAPGARWAEEQYAQRFGGHSDSFTREYTEWIEAHPRPKDDAAEEERIRYWRSALAMSQEWEKKWPTEQMVATQKINAALNLPDVTNQALLKMIDAATARKVQFPPLLVGEVYVRRAIRLDRVPALVEQALAATAKRDEQMRRVAERVNEKQRETMLARVGSSWWSATSLGARAHLAMGNVAKAGAKIEEMEKRLEAERPGQNATEASRVEHRRRAAIYWDARARLAARQRQNADAVAYWIRASRLTDHASAPESPESELNKFWKKLGGSPDGLRALREVEPQSEPKSASVEETPWIRQERPLPELKYSDLSGKAWSLTELQGKVTFMNVWATWCVPCRQELPYLERLAKQYGGKNIVFLTINVDENIGLVEPFVKTQRLALPVLAALAYGEPHRRTAIFATRLPATIRWLLPSPRRRSLS